MRLIYVETISEVPIISLLSDFSMPYSLLVAPIFFQIRIYPTVIKIANTPILQSRTIYVATYPNNVGN